MKRLALLGGIALAMLMPASASAFKQNPCTVTPSPVAAGQPVTVVGTNFHPGALMEISWGSFNGDYYDDYVSVVVASDGTVTSTEDDVTPTAGTNWVRI